MATGVDMIGTVLNATEPHQIFGSADAETARPIYRRLARNVHPDRNPDQQQRATDAFANLERLWQLLAGGGAPTSNVITTKRHAYTLGEVIGRGDFATVYSATYDVDQLAAVKIIRRPADSDLLAAETRSLKKLKDVPEEYRRFFPEIIDVFRHRDAASNKTRSALVTNLLSGFYTIREVIETFPNGTDPRDMAWMFRRLLVAVGNAHDVGVVHGAVTPDNVLIHPEMHGLTLVGWTCSVSSGDPLKAASPGYRHFYSADAVDKKPVSGSLDLRMAAMTMEQLLPANSARQFSSFFRGCRISSTPPARELLGEFDDLLERLYGRRRFRPFVMPRRKDI